MKISKAIEIKLQWRQNRYQPPTANEMNADMMSIEALKAYTKSQEAGWYPPGYKLPGEDPE